jgi:NADPH2:quinone reductase
MQRKGLYPPPPGASEILGMECAGIVEQIGTGVTNFAVGDRVMALIPGGGYAEFAVADQGCTMPIPKHFNWAQAAAVPEVFLTSWQALRFNSDCTKGKKVLIHAGASGVGTAACQIVERVLGGTAITTSSKEKVHVCKRYATHCVDRSPDDQSKKCFSSKVSQLIGFNSVDIVIDPVVGGTYMEENAELLATDGTLVVIALMGGSVIEKCNLTPFFRKRAIIRFSTLRNRSPEYKTALVESFIREALPRFKEGDDGLHPVIDRTFPMEQVSAAHAALESNESAGKVVLLFE